MSIAVTLPVEAPTNLQATLLDGGSLAANTTYYYIVIAYDQTYYSPRDSDIFSYHSPISTEASFTTTTTKKSVLINWDNSTGATRYQILLTTVSGDYTNSGGYGTASENVGSISDGVAGYTITALSSEVYVIHSIQLVNSFVGDISRTLGILKIDFTGTATHDLQDVYDAIVSAGFSDYVNYDESRFVFKGWFISSGSDAGSLVVEKKSLVFLKGGIHCGNINYIMRFGKWTSDLVGANYQYGCKIDIQNSRYPIRSKHAGVLQIYGSMVTFGHSRKTNLTEIKTNGGYTGELNIYLSSYIDEIKDNILGSLGRSINGRIVDTKWGQGFDWGRDCNIRLKIYEAGVLPYFAGGKFYACNFVTFSTPLSTWVPNATCGYFTDMYDCLFPNYPDEMIQYPYFYYVGLQAPDYQSNNYVNFNYTLAIKVLDIDGVPIEGATISLKDKDGNPVTWIEHDGTYDKLVTGNTFIADRITGASGEIDYYVKSYKISLNPENTDHPTSYDIIKTDSYPFTLTISKAGYQTYETILDKLNEKCDYVVALMEKNYVRQTLGGKLQSQSIKGVIGTTKLKGTIK